MEIVSGFRHNSKDGTVEMVGTIVLWPTEREAKPRGQRGRAIPHSVRASLPILPQELRLVVLPTQIASSVLHGSEDASVEVGYNPLRSRAKPAEV